MIWQRTRDYSLFLMTGMFLFGTNWACKIDPDPAVVNGLAVDCSHQGLTPETLRTLDFPVMTSLIINTNSIPVLKNNSFTQHRHLRKLVCESCNMRYLEVDALKGLNNLELLSLTKNKLNMTSNAFPRGVFRHVPNLKTLHIGYNGNHGNASSYSEFIEIFDSFRGLEELSIDSFSNLRIGKEFIKLTQLKSLTIVCKNVIKITSNSFKGFQESNLKHLVLSEAEFYNTQIDHMTFQYLPNVSSLWLSYFHVGNLFALKMMQPLQGRRLDEIKFNSIQNLGGVRGSREVLHESIINPEDTQFLTNISVSHFIWELNNVRAVHSGAFMSILWRSCLKSFYFTTGKTFPLTDLIFLYRYSRYKVLERFVSMRYPRSIGQNFWEEEIEPEHDNNKSTKPTLYMPKEITHRIKKREINCIMNRNCSHGLQLSQDMNGYPEVNPKREKSENPQSFHGISQDSVNGTVLSPAVGHQTDFRNISQFHIRKRSPLFRLRLPPNLKTIVLDEVGTVEINADYMIRENNLRGLYFRKNHGRGVIIRGKLLGLKQLMTIDFSDSRVEMVPEFFKSLPSLSRLVLKNTQQDSKFYSECAKNGPGLEYYDISDNDLLRLPEKTFYLSRKLKYLSLASNRFPNLPLDLSLTPDLKILDLRMNSLVDLPLKDRQSIDEHVVRVHGMTVLLDKNPISCTCSALPFLKWLFQTTRAQFDKGGNYTCFSEDGSLSYTAFHSDIKSFWRKCQGHYYFLISLILAFTLATIYLTVYLGTTHKTQIISKVMQLVNQDFRLQTRQDFNYDVCIGYADQDGEYVRNTLLRYLENMWQLRTFVHQRDMLHDPLLMSYAIKDSWRNVLLITENFLDRHNMAHNIMKVATFFVSPSNPRSVVVMVEESVRHRIPDYVLHVIDEDNIIILPSLESFLEYEAKEMLKNRILY